ncbi:hypothetical protein FSST1_006818 [Fusarium sambucinum]
MASKRDYASVSSAQEADEVRCDRKYPCAYCTRTGHTCTYPQKHKPKEKRQRVFISQMYERKIDDIVQKLGEFGTVLGAIQNSARITIPATTPTINLSHSPSATSAAPKGETSAETLGSELLTPRLEHQGESSLAAQATFANKFLEDAIINKPNGIDITAEMSSVLESLRQALGRSSNHQERDYLYPHARDLGSGLHLRNLPMPPIEKVFICLRMAKENARVRFFWNNEVTLFSDYCVKVYSPGEATHADLIIANGGLYWMFQQCRHAVTDSSQKADFEAQAVICRDNLETVLANLPFHQPSKVETVASMMIACIYCLETCKPSAAWDFIATASHMSQTLGMHSKVAMIQDSPETKATKIKLFWQVYVYEKGLSLRLGRSSTIRDSDITIPVARIDPRSETSYFSHLEKMKDLAHLQGKIYDHLYSSGALAQPQHIRTSRARCLAGELEVHSNRAGKNETLYAEALRQATSNEFLEVFTCTEKVIHLSLICLTYRAIPPEANQGTIFGRECISSAHKALKAHRRCMSLVAELDNDFLQSYVNMAILHSPFVPFTVVFCHIIETCDKHDIDLLESVIEALKSATDSVPSSGVRKEYHLFKALYDAACSYIEARLSKAHLGFHTWANTSIPATVLSPANQQPVIMTPVSNLESSEAAAGLSMDGTAEWMSQSFDVPSAADFDQYGAQLGNWLHMNSQMIRALEDSYF